MRTEREKRKAILGLTSTVKTRKRRIKKKGVGWGWGGYVIDKEHGERQKAKGDEEQKEK